MRSKAEVTEKRVEFIKANPQLTMNEMAEALGIDRNRVEAHCTYYRLPYKSAMKVAQFKKQESEFFNVHSHSDWMVGKY